jgi:hypothetical protein
MSIDRIVFLFAGLVVLISVGLSQVHDPAWLWLTAFVGANLAQASLTGFCPLALIVKKLGAQPGKAFG